MSILAERIETLLAQADARVRAQTRNGARNGQYGGRREDSEPTDGLPRLRYGFDRLPTRCGHCGSTFLETEPPGLHAETGSVTCCLCSRQQCWIAGSVSRGVLP